MGKSTISMAIFNSYVKLPEGKWLTQIDNQIWRVAGKSHVCSMIFPVFD